MIRGLLIGAGYFAQYQVEAWARVSGGGLVGLVDLDRQKAAALAEPHGLPAFDDLDQALDTLRPDFLDIATPPSSHAALVNVAIERGLAVICQKPLADNYDDAARIVAAAEAADIPFMVHENWRWQPWYRTMQRALAEERIGQPFALSFNMRLGDGWQPDAYLARQPYFRDYPRLLLHETGVHFIDTFRFLFGEVSSVYARIHRRNQEIAGEDAALLVLNFSSGVTATFDASRYNETEPEDRRFTFGELRLDTSTGHLLLTSAGELRWKPLGQLSVTFAAPPVDTGFAGDSVRELQQHFVDRLGDGQPFESNGADYLRTLRVVEACYRSAETGLVVELDD